MPFNALCRCDWNCQSNNAKNHQIYEQSNWTRVWVKLSRTQKSHHRIIIIITKTILIFCHIECELGEWVCERATQNRYRIQLHSWNMRLWYLSMVHHNKCNQSLSFTRTSLHYLTIRVLADWQKPISLMNWSFWLPLFVPEKYTHTHDFFWHFRTFIHPIHCIAHTQMSVCTSSPVAIVQRPFVLSADHLVHF